MKITHVLRSYRAEGTPRLVLDWLREPGYQQNVIFIEPKGELFSEFLETGRSIHINKEFKISFRNGFKLARFIKSVIAKTRPDVVVCWDSGMAMWILIGAYLGGCRKLIMHAGNPAGSGLFEKYIYSFLSFTVLNLIHVKMAACSEYVAKSYDFFFTPRHFIYPVANCIDQSNFRSGNQINKKKKQAIMVATLERHKDHQTLLKAWGQVQQLISGDIQLLIVGDGSLRSDLESLSRQLALRNIQFLGSRKDVPDLLFESEVFVLSTTDQEGFGTVIVEALSAGCNVIASDVPACREVLQNGLYGTLVKRGDDQALCTGLINAFMNPISLEKQNRQIAYSSQFSPQQMISSYIEIAELN